MEVHLSPELEKKLDELSSLTGRPAGELVRDAVAGLVHDLTGVRGMLDSRYDDLQSGRVKPIDGEEAFARLREKSELRRA